MSNPFQLLANESSDNDGVEDEFNDVNLPHASTDVIQNEKIQSTEENAIQNQVKSQQDNQKEEQSVKEDLKESIEEENFDPDHPTPEQIKNCPTVFEALGMEENRRVLWTFVGISLSLIIVGFGSFYLGKKYIPFFFPSIDPYDAPIYSCGLAVVLTQIIIFSFFFWAWGHDVAEEKREKELEEQMRKEKMQKKIKKD